MENGVVRNSGSESFNIDNPEYAWYIKNRYMFEPNLGEADLIYAGNGSDYVFAGFGDDIVFGDDGIDLLYGQAGNDTLIGGDHDDKIYGDDDFSPFYYTPGNDVLYGGQGNDRLYGNDGNDILYGGKNDDILEGGAGNDILSGDAGQDKLFGGEGNDILFGSGDGDLLDGGIGNDTIYVGKYDFLVSLDEADTIIYLDKQNDPEQLPTANSASISLNPLLGSASLSITLGQAHFDIENGLAANTNVTYTFGDSSQILHSEFVGTRLYNVVNFSSNAAALFGGAFDDFIVATGTIDSSLYGGLGSDTLTGNSGNNILYGDAGADTLIGGLGDDNYNIDESGDNVVELTDEGTDTVISTISYALNNNLEHLILSGTASINGTGNELDNQITGNVLNNILIGGVGNDQLKGGDGNDTYSFSLGDGADTIEDSSGTNVIVLGAGINPEEVTISRDAWGNDLIVNYSVAGDQITITNWYFSMTQQFNSIQFEDGTVWSKDYLTSESLSGDDLIEGEYSTENILNGYGGNDTIFGGNKNDISISPVPTV